MYLQTAIDLANTGATALDAGSSFMSSLSAFATAAVASFLSLVGTASIIAKYLPPPIPGTFLAKVHRWVNRVGQNDGYAENRFHRIAGDQTGYGTPIGTTCESESRPLSTPPPGENGHA